MVRAHDCNKFSEKTSNSQKSKCNNQSSNATKRKRAIKRPVIKVVHVFAPQHVHTDAANFRDLVQQMTGLHSKINYASNDTDNNTTVPNHPPNHDTGIPDRSTNYPYSPSVSYSSEACSTAEDDLHNYAVYNDPFALIDCNSNYNTTTITNNNHNNTSHHQNQNPNMSCSAAAASNQQNTTNCRGCDYVINDELAAAPSSSTISWDSSASSCCIVNEDHLSFGDLQDFYSAQEFHDSAHSNYDYHCNDASSYFF